MCVCVCVLFVRRSHSVDVVDDLPSSPKQSTDKTFQTPVCYSETSHCYNWATSVSIHFILHTLNILTSFTFSELYNKIK